MKRLKSTIINKPKQLNLNWLDFKRVDVILIRELNLGLSESSLMLGSI
jgi:hypothetical protein